MIWNWKKNSPSKRDDATVKNTARIADVFNHSDGVFAKTESPISKPVQGINLVIEVHKFAN